MAVDLGKARTGIAICDKLEMLSSPLTQISEYNRERLLEKIYNLAKEKKAELIVVGLPKNMDGSEGDSAKGAREFAEKLAEMSGINVDMQDERGTTITLTLAEDSEEFLDEYHLRSIIKKYCSFLPVEIYVENTDKLEEEAKKKEEE